MRDLDVLEEASARAEVSVYFSIPTLDERRLAHDGARHRAAPLAARAVRGLSEAGIDVGVGMAPILPGLSDRPEQLEEVVREARAAGARSIWANVVRLRPGEREHFLERSRRTGRRRSSATRRCSRPARTSPPRSRSRSSSTCAR